jgi:predicted dienelactone hydrolase
VTRNLWMVVLAAAACGGTQNPGDGSQADASTSQADAPSTTDATSSAIDPADDGTFTVTESTASIPGAENGRVLASTIFAPAGGTSRPLVIVSPGFQMDAAQYTSYAQHLATWGFVVILTDYADTSFFPNHSELAADVPAVIDWALAQTSLAVDATKIAATGHSLGGKISVFAATLDARIKAVVAWDPVDSTNPSVAPQLMTSMTAAVAVVGETTNGSGGGMPCAPSAENFQQFYAAAPSPALEVTVTGADHMDWVDDPSCGFCGFCSPGAADAERARRVSRRIDVAWLRRHVLGDTAMDTWLTNPPELAAGHVAIRAR